MVKIEFTSQLAQHVECPMEEVSAASLRQAFDAVFDRNPALRGYVLDDQGRVRQHVAVFIDNQMLRDRVQLDLPLNPTSEIFVMQALSGG